MANTLTAAPERRGANPWERAIAIAALLVLLAGLLGGWWLLRGVPPRDRTAIEPNLLALIEPSGVPPYLVLMVLSDYPADQVWQEALRAGEWDGALATWLFGPLRPDRSAIEALLALAEAQGPTGPDDAAAYLLAAADLARLSPELGDRERAELLLGVGERMSALGARGAATEEWRQADIVARFAPALPALYRATLLHDLAALYRGVGDRGREARALEQAAQAGRSGPPLAAPERPLLETGDVPEPPDPLLAAQAARRAAAEAAGQALQGGEPTLIAAAYADLRNALDAEEAAHSAWIEPLLAAAPTLEGRAALLIHQIEWLQRARLLALGVGGDPFAGWATRLPALEAALHDSWEALEATRLEQSVATGRQQDATLAQRDWWATRLLHARLGHDPALDQTSLIASMRPNNADGAGDTMLRLDWIAGRFWRVPRDSVVSSRLPE